MSTVTMKRPRVKPERKVRLALKPFEGNPGVVDITVGKDLTSYFVFPIPSDFGTAFRLEKFGGFGGEVYNVNLDGEGSSCECKGFLRWNHCKHAEGLRALRQAGQL